MKRKIISFAALCLSSLALMSCGGGGGSSSSTPITTPPTSGGGSGGATGDPVVLSNIVYGKGATDTGDIDLLLDIYQPSDICDANRPTVFFVHGGAFIGGDKVDANTPARSEATNDKGFNFVSINYRLVGNQPVLGAGYQAIYDAFVAANTDPTIILEQVEASLAAYEDAVAALNWLQDNANENCLDMSRLAYWGSSAGAYTVLNAAYNSDQFGFARPDPSVVINYWGALPFTENMDFMEAPFMTVHGDQDDIVDYQAALDIAARADIAGVPYSFYTHVGGGHGVNTNRTVNGVTLLDLTLNFIEAHIVGGTPLYETADVD